MNNFEPLIIYDEATPLANLSEFEFSEAKIDSFGFGSEQTLDTIVFQVFKKPNDLAVHLQRIYFCYHHDLQEDLFGALVDFLIILEGKGHVLGTKMVQGSKAKLQSQHYALLNKALRASDEQVKFLPGNKYSLFSRGFIGTHILVIKEENTEQAAHDPLDIARDFMAYSQLDQAMNTLENAILVDIERQVLHDDLLELYRATRSVERFTKMYDALLEQTKTIPASWNELKGFFNEG